MKFVQRDLGEAAEASGGGGGPGLLREIALMGGALLVLTLTLWFGIGWTTELILPRISPATENRWFGSLTPDMAKLDANLDPAQLAHRNRAAAVLARLAADPAVPRLNYRLFVLPGPKPNAFAFPGGAIGVTEGMLSLVGEDVPLAFVLGHELGHFVQRDHLRGMGRQAGRQIAWLLLFGGNGGDFLSTQLSTLLDLGHSRSQEAGADDFGLDLVHRIYGTTAGTDLLFTWFEKREGGSAALALFRSHPAATDRLTRLRARATQLTPPTAP